MLRALPVQILDYFSSNCKCDFAREKNLGNWSNLTIMFSHSVLCNVSSELPFPILNSFSSNCKRNLWSTPGNGKEKLKYPGLTFLVLKVHFCQATEERSLKCVRLKKRPSENVLGIKKFILFYKLFWLTVRIQLRICKFFEIIRPIYSNNKRSKQLIKQNTFLACYWRFFRSNTLEWIKRQLE